MKLQLPCQKAFQKFYSRTLVAKRRRRRGRGRVRNYRRRGGGDHVGIGYGLWFLYERLQHLQFPWMQNENEFWYLCGAKSSTTTMTTTTCVLQMYLIKMYFMQHTQIHTHTRAHKDILLLPFLIFIASKNFCFAILSLSPWGNCLLTSCCCCCSCSYCCFIYLPNTCRWQHNNIFHINCAFFTSLSLLCSVNWLAMRRLS